MNNQSSAYYLMADGASLLAAVPKMTLSKPDRALSFLKSIVDDGLELKSALSSYPRMRVEPLDFHYVCLQSLGALDVHLISDLTSHHGWPGAVWAGFLAALAPSAAYAPHLTAAISSAPHNQWILRVALDMIEGREPCELAEHTALLHSLRTQLDDLTLPRITLRVNPSEQAAIELQDRVRTAYRDGGSSAALAITRQRALDAP